MGIVGRHLEATIRAWRSYRQHARLPNFIESCSDTLRRLSIVIGHYFSVSIIFGLPRSLYRDTSLDFFQKWKAALFIVIRLSLNHCRNVKPNVISECSWNQLPQNSTRCWDISTFPLERPFRGSEGGGRGNNGKKIVSNCRCIWHICFGWSAASADPHGRSVYILFLITTHDYR